MLSCKGMHGCRHEELQVGFQSDPLNNSSKLSMAPGIVSGACLGLQEKAPLIGFAMGSGVCIFFGNMAEQYALALAGVTIAVPMFSSCIVVLGAQKLLINACLLLLLVDGRQTKCLHACSDIRQ